MTTELEYNTKAIPLDHNLPAEMERLQKEGWQLAPGAAPIGIYHLVRAKNQISGMGGNVSMAIDESKVFVIPAGQKSQ